MLNLVPSCHIPSLPFPRPLPNRTGDPTSDGEGRNQPPAHICYCKRGYHFVCMCILQSYDFFIYGRVCRRLLCIWSPARIPVGYLLCFNIPGVGARGGCSADTFWMMISIWDSQRRYCCELMSRENETVCILRAFVLCLLQPVYHYIRGVLKHPLNEKITCLPGVRSDIIIFYWNDTILHVFSFRNDNVYKIVIKNNCFGETAIVCGDCFCMKLITWK